MSVEEHAGEVPRAGHGPVWGLQFNWGCAGPGDDPRSGGTRVLEASGSTEALGGETGDRIVAERYVAERHRPGISTALSPRVGTTPG